MSPNWLGPRTGAAPSSESGLATGTGTGDFLKKRTITCALAADWEIV